MLDSENNNQEVSRIGGLYNNYKFSVADLDSDNDVDIIRRRNSCLRIWDEDHGDREVDCSGSAYDNQNGQDVADYDDDGHLEFLAVDGDNVYVWDDIHNGASSANRERLYDPENYDDGGQHLFGRSDQYDQVQGNGLEVVDADRDGNKEVYVPVYDNDRNHEGIVSYEPATDEVNIVVHTRNNDVGSDQRDGLVGYADMENDNDLDLIYSDDDYNNHIEFFDMGTRQVDRSYGGERIYGSTPGEGVFYVTDPFGNGEPRVYGESCGEFVSYYLNNNRNYDINNEEQSCNDPMFRNGAPTPPHTQNITFHDVTANDATIKVEARDQTNDDQIESCEVKISDEDGNSRTYTDNNPDYSYGSAQQVQCEVNVERSDVNGWDMTETLNVVAEPEDKYLNGAGYGMEKGFSFQFEAIPEKTAPLPFYDNDEVQFYDDDTGQTIRPRDGNVWGGQNQDFFGTADFQNDGNLDLIFMNDQEEISIWNAETQAIEATRVGDQSSWDQNHLMEVADVKGDGNLDIFGASGDFRRWYDDGSRDGRDTEESNNNVNNDQNSETADIDNDGKLEMVYSDGSDRLYQIDDIADGNRDSRQQIFDIDSLDNNENLAGNPNDINYPGLFVLDADRDGKKEAYMTVSNAGDGNRYAVLSYEFSTGNAKIIFDTGSPDLQQGIAGFGNVDGDDDLDMIAWSNDYGEYRYYDFGRDDNYVFSDPGDSDYTGYVSDYNGDSRPEVYYADSDDYRRTSESDSDERLRGGIYDSHMRDFRGKVPNAPNGISVSLDSKSNSDHAFTLTGVARDRNDDGDIQYCSFEVSDGQGNSYTYGDPDPDLSYGSPKEAQCEVTVNMADSAGWSLSDSMDVRFKPVDKYLEGSGYAMKENNVASFPNHPPVGDSISTSDIGDKHGVTVEAFATDTDNGNSEISSCTVYTDDGDGNKNSISGSININAGDSDQARCEADVTANDFPEIEVNEDITFKAQFADKHGAKGNTSTVTSDIPNRPPKIESGNTIIDQSGKHAFTVSALASDAEGTSGISFCDVRVDDGDGAPKSLPGSLDRSAGDSNEALCTRTVSASNHDSFEKNESVNVRVEFTDDYGASTVTGQSTTSFPDRVPSVTLENPEDNEVLNGSSFTLNVSISDPEDDDLNVSFFDSEGSKVGANLGVSGEFSTLDWSRDLGDYQWYARVNETVNSAGSDSTFNFSVRNVTFRNYRVNDSVVNPFQDYEFMVDIREFNGSDYYDVVSGDFSVDYRGDSYELSHVSGSTWSTTLTSTSSLGDKSPQLNVSGFTGVNDLYDDRADEVDYRVENITSNVSLSDRIVDQGQEFDVYGNARIQPDDVDASGSVDVLIDDSPAGGGVLGPGNYNVSVIAPDELGDHVTGVEFDNSDAVNGLNSTGFEVRNLTFENYRLDDYIVNPDQTVEFSVDIYEFNGTGKEDVDSGEFNIAVNNTGNFSLQHSFGSTWSTDMPADTVLGDRVHTVNVSGNSSVNDIRDYSEKEISYEVRNVSIDLSITNRSLFSNDDIPVTGGLTLNPQDEGFSDTINAWVDMGDGFVSLDSMSSNSIGSFSSNLNGVVPAGTHVLKVNTSDSENITGFETQTFNVSLNISEENSTFITTGSKYVVLDDEVSETIEFNAYLNEPKDSNIRYVKAEVTDPNGVEFIREADNAISLTGDKANGDYWNTRINTDNKFSNVLGRYDVKFVAETKNGIKSNIVNDEFFIQEKSIQNTVSNNNITFNQVAELSGTGYLQPNNIPLTGDVNVDIAGALNDRVLDLTSGSYSSRISSEKAGSNSINISWETQAGVFNFSDQVNVFNLSTTITEVSTDNESGVVFKDEDVSSDVNVSDRVVADTGNPYSVKDMNISYDVPYGWNVLTDNSEVGILSPGESAQNNPKFDIGTEAYPGKYNISLTTDTKENISYSDKETLEVWTKSGADYLNINRGDTISRTRSSFVVKANITDIYGGRPLEGINATLRVSKNGGSSYITVTNSSDSDGLVELEFNVTGLAGGEHNMFLRARDSPNKYINTSEEIGSNRISFTLQGKLKEGTRLNIDPVSRLGGSDTSIGGTLTNFDGVDQEDVTMFAKVGNKVLGPQNTSGLGGYSFSYNPDDTTVPGNYTIELNASKNDFADFYFNRSVAVRGRLDISNEFNKNVITRGKAESFNSEVTNSLDNEENGNVSWSLDSNIFASGEDTESKVPISVDIGTYSLSASTHREFFDDDSDSTEVDVYGLADVELKPDDFDINPGNNIEFKASVKNQRNEGVASYPVSFYVNGAEYPRITNETGVATFSYTLQNGDWNISAVIEDNSNLMYNVSNSIDSTEIESGRDISFNKFTSSEKSIYRHLKTPYRTVFDVNVTKTTDSIDREPVGGAEVNVVVNGTDELNCTTTSNGDCEDPLVYNPTGNVSVGNISVEASTESGLATYDEANSEKNLIVEGKLEPEIITPNNGDGYPVGQSLVLSSIIRTVAGEDVVTPANWKVNDNKIGSDTNDTWFIPSDFETGEKTINLNTDGEYFIQGSDSVDIILQSSVSPKLVIPENESSKGFSDTYSTECVVSDGSKNINKYPVVFLDNRSGDMEVFDSVLTQPQDGTYKASTTWSPPESSQSIEMGCRIASNQTLGYKAATKNDTKIYDLTDNKPPEIQNLTVKPEIANFDSTVDITFNVTDNSGIKDVNITVTNPSGGTSQVSVRKENERYNGTFNTPSDLSGTYDARVSAVDESGNQGSVVRTFQVNPGGNLEISKEEIRADNITANSGQEFEIEANLYINDSSAQSVNLTASSDEVNFEQSKFQCGDLTGNNYCNRSFIVEIPKGTPPTDGVPKFIRFTGQWFSNSENTEISRFSSLSIDANPILEERTGNRTGESKNQLSHGSQENITFTLDSRGNTPIRGLQITEETANISSNLVKVPDNDLDSGEIGDIVLRLNAPEVISPGEYSTNLTVKSTNEDTISRSIETDVPKDVSYSLTDSISTSGIEGATGNLVNIPVESDANVDLILESSFESTDGEKCGDKLSSDTIRLDKGSSENISVEYSIPSGFAGKCDVNMSTSLGSPENSNPKEIPISINVYNYDVNAEIYNSTTKPGNVENISFNVSLANTIRTEGISYKIFVGDRKAKIVNEEISGSSFHVNYTVPNETEKARYHNVTLEVTEDKVTQGVTQEKVFEDVIRVPDLLAPEYNEFSINDVDPGDNVTIEADVFDNSKRGVKNVTAVLRESNSSKTYKLTKNNNKWVGEITNVSKGSYAVEFTAFDYSNLSTNTTKYFRASEEVGLNENIVTPSGSAKKNVKIRATDVRTGKVRESSTDEFGEINLSLRNGVYDIEAEFDGQKVNLQNTSVEENVSQFIVDRLNPTETSGLAPVSASSRISGLAVKTSLNTTSGTIKYNYSNFDIPSSVSLENLKISKCDELNYTNLNCESELKVIELNQLDINKAKEIITKDVSGFSAFTLYAPEIEDNQSIEVDPVDPDVSVNPDVNVDGGASEESVRSLQEEVENTSEQVSNISKELDGIPSLNQSERSKADIGTSKIQARLQPGENTFRSLRITNTKNVNSTYEFTELGFTSEYIEVGNAITIEPGGTKSVRVNISAPLTRLPGTYTGEIKFESSDVDGRVPVEIEVTPASDRSLSFSTTSIFDYVGPGENATIEATLSTEGYRGLTNVTVNMSLVDSETDKEISNLTEYVSFRERTRETLQLQIPNETDTGSYLLRSSATFTNGNTSELSTSSTSVNINRPFWQREIIGTSYTSILAGVITLFVLSVGGYRAYIYYLRRMRERRRYLEKIDLDTIPSDGEEQAYVGKLAELEKDTYIDLEQMTEHTLIAGATGSGKTVTGQLVAEEALKQGKNVIVLDPTAQWTGFLRKNKDEEMLSKLSEFGMNVTDAQSFDGNIRAVEPGDTIDIKPYLEEDEEGNIIIFSLHKLDSKNIDEFISNTIQQVFDANLPERDSLETVICYDEAHRILDKYGGSGEGSKQLERGAREFRKYGVGLMLLSQVISDFPGEVRANIGTTIQMRTEYKEDLKRIKSKFGTDTVKSIAKAAVGSGMIQNSEYNHGRPYFANFRPLLHSPHRLKDEELEKYEEYNSRIDEIEDKVQDIEQDETDLYSIENELKLARRNLRKGSFSLVETYLDEIENELENL